MKEIEQFDDNCENLKALLRIQRKNNNLNNVEQIKFFESDKESSQNNHPIDSARRRWAANLSLSKNHNLN